MAACTYDCIIKQVLDTTLNAADKISLLLGALAKEAAKCAGRAERLDDMEFSRIWAKLDKTYDNTYQQVHSHAHDTQSVHI